MRLDNNPNYNTKQSDIKAFNEFVPDVEKQDLTKLDTTALKNQNEIGNINTNGRLKYNKVTKTWQKLSKAEVKDKLTALEKLKTFEQVINENTTESDAGLYLTQGMTWEELAHHIMTMPENCRRTKAEVNYYVDGDMESSIAISINEIEPLDDEYPVNCWGKKIREDHN